MQVYRIAEAHGTQLFYLVGSDILKTKEEYKNFKIVDSSVCYNTYLLLRYGNKNEQKLLKIHPIIIQFFFKIFF